MLEINKIINSKLHSSIENGKTRGFSFTKNVSVFFWFMGQTKNIERQLCKTLLLLPPFRLKKCTSSKISCMFSSEKMQEILESFCVEEWLSGLRHWFAKSAYIFVVPWVRIPFLPLVIYPFFRFSKKKSIHATGFKSWKLLTVITCWAGVVVDFFWPKQVPPFTNGENLSLHFFPMHVLSIGKWRISLSQIQENLRSNIEGDGRIPISLKRRRAFFSQKKQIKLFTAWELKKFFPELRNFIINF